MRRVNSARSIGFSSLIKIPREKFIDLLRENSPDDFEKFCQIRDSIIFERKYKSID